MAFPHIRDKRSDSLPPLADDTPSKPTAAAPVKPTSQPPVSVAGSASTNTHSNPGGWGGLPAPALVQIGSSLPQHDAVMLRLVCKAWATHLGDVLTEAAPSPYPMLAHQTARKAGPILTLSWLHSGITAAPCKCRLHALHDTCTLQAAVHFMTCAYLQMQNVL